MEYKICIQGQEITLRHFRDYPGLICYAAFLTEIGRARSVDLLISENSPTYCLRINGPWKRELLTVRSDNLAHCQVGLNEKITELMRAMKDFTQVTQEEWVEREKVANTLGRYGQL